MPAFLGREARERTETLTRREERKDKRISAVRRIRRKQSRKKVNRITIHDTKPRSNNAEGRKEGMKDVRKEGGEGER